MTFKIACIGEPLAEISSNIHGFSVAYGGDTMNTAIYAARCPGTSVSYMTAVGTDTLSDGAVALLEAEAIDTRYVRRDPNRQIGIYSITNDAAGERNFHYWRSDSAARCIASEDDPMLNAFADFDVVYLSGITLAVLSQAARDRLWLALQKADTSVAFDSNYRETLWQSPKLAQLEISRFWQITDIALPTIEDEAALFGDSSATETINRLRAANARSGALKCGADGPIPIANIATLPPFEKAEIVVDTTGAGDSFNGSYLGLLAQDMPEELRLQGAHSVAKSVIGHKGAIPPKDVGRPTQRMGMLIGLKPETKAEYIKLHADVWPKVLDRLSQSNITNYSIFLREPENLMFSYWEYTGDDFAADDAAIAADPVTQKWWSICGPMQDPLATRTDGDWWADMREVFHLD